MSAPVPTPPPHITELPTPIIVSSPVPEGDPLGIVLLLVVLAALLIVLVWRGAYAWLCAGLLLIGFDVARLNMTGVAVIGALFLVVAGGLFGMFRRDFWFAPTPAGAVPVTQPKSDPSAPAPAGSPDGQVSA